MNDATFDRIYKDVARQDVVAGYRDNGDTDGIDVRSTGMTTDKLHAAEASRLAADLDTLGSILAAMGATVANGAVTCPHPAMVTASEAALIEQLTRAHS